MNRTRLATLNSATVFITQIISLVLKFGVQTVFIHQLSQSFLGLNGLFANVISFLSFADLGIGTSITVALYKPIANNDEPALKGLLRLYRKIYLIIGSVITIGGILIAPFIHFFIKNSSFSAWQVGLWFTLYLISTSATYFAAYKRSFLMAAQQGYLSSLNDFSFKSIQMILQIIVVSIWHSYLWFLIIQLVCVVGSNIQISSLTERKYKGVFAASTNEFSPDQSTLSSIKKNVVGSISSNIGSIAVFGTDNIILSAFVGLVSVARYSNYMLLIQSLNSLFSQALKAAVASVGNLNVTANNDRKEDILLKMLYLNSVINIILVTGLAVGIQFFIQKWAGVNYLLSTTVVVFILLNFLVNQFRYSAQNFISGMGLFWPLRWKALIEAGINLIVSLTLVIFYKMGVSGVVIGTLSSNVLINSWWEPWIVYHYELKRSIKRYMQRYISYLSLSIIAMFAGLKISIIISNENWVAFILCELASELLVLFMFVLFTFRTAEFRYYKNMFINLLHKMFRNS